MTGKNTSVNENKEQFIMVLPNLCIHTGSLLLSCYRKHGNHSCSTTAKAVPTPATTTVFAVKFIP